MDPQESVRRAVLDVLEAKELGMQVVAYLGGELVVDLAEGTADEQTGRPVTKDTIFTIFSATKAVAAAAVHVQAERGLLDYDAPISQYWPEFSQHGKDSTTVRDALTHRTGVPQMPPDTTPEEMCDWEHMVQTVAALEPLWEPGTRSGYHAYTFGWIVGELVRRTDPAQRPFGKFVQEEICAPLGMESFWMGIPDAVEERVSRLKNVEGRLPLPPESILPLAIPESLGTNQEVFGRPDVRRSCHPGAGGISDARSLARFYRLYAEGGTVDGNRLFSAERARLAGECQSDETDAVLGAPYRRGLGYFLGGQPISASGSPIGPNPRALGHPGAGGSIGFADPDAGLAVAITKNRMLAVATPEENPVKQVADAVRDALGIN